MRRSLSADGAEPSLVIHWVESGVSLAPKPQARSGFGTELLQRTLAYDLRGETKVTYASDGIRYLIRLPVSDRLIVTAPEAATPQYDANLAGNARTTS